MLTRCSNLPIFAKTALSDGTRVKVELVFYKLGKKMLQIVVKQSRRNSKMVKFCNSDQTALSDGARVEQRWVELARHQKCLSVEARPPTRKQFGLKCRIQFLDCQRVPRCNYPCQLKHGKRAGPTESFILGSWILDACQIQDFGGKTWNLGSWIWENSKIC